jgi:murein DD-endopeptidase MepM/ murein hydrolase activator NlpD
MYGHLSRIIVTDGQNVDAGQVIGLSGNSGRSTAPHLHFEIRQRGTSLDPRTMVKQGG